MRNKTIKRDSVFKRIALNLQIFILTCFVALSCSNDDIQIDNYLSIPDSHFETKLIEQGIDSDGILNQKMLKSDAEDITHLDLNLSANFGQITDLTGVEGFVNLTLLSAANQKIEAVDLSYNIKLDTLNMLGNHLTNIDLSKNLIFVDLQSNELKSELQIILKT